MMPVKPSFTLPGANAVARCSPGNSFHRMELWRCHIMLVNLGAISCKAMLDNAAARRSRCGRQHPFGTGGYDMNRNSTSLRWTAAVGSVYGIRPRGFALVTSGWGRLALGGVRWVSP